MNANYGNGSEGSSFTPAQIFARNAPFVKPGANNFQTTLAPAQEQDFLKWIAANKVPFDPTQKNPDYDMRGFYQALMAGNPLAKSAVDPNDGRLHFPDHWKTPYDLTFSAQSQWANPQTAPDWNAKDQLVTKDGKVIYDDRLETMRKISRLVPNPSTMAAVVTLLSNLRALQGMARK